jgi:hypothetical protein
MREFRNTVLSQEKYGVYPISFSDDFDNVADSGSRDVTEIVNSQFALKVLLLS